MLWIAVALVVVSLAVIIVLFIPRQGPAAPAQRVARPAPPPASGAATLTPRDILLRGGMSPSDHAERFFLDASDLPPGMDLHNDSEFTLRSATPGREAEWFGRMMWMDPGTSAQIMDLRWLFPSDADADRFLTGGLQDLSEKMSPIPLPSPLHQSGTPGHLFGQTLEMMGIKLAQLNYVFRSGRAVVKVFIARTDEVPECAKMLKPLIPKIEARLAECARPLAPVPADGDLAGIKAALESRSGLAGLTLHRDRLGGIDFLRVTYGTDVDVTAAMPPDVDALARRIKTDASRRQQVDALLAIAAAYNKEQGTENFKIPGGIPVKPLEGAAGIGSVYELKQYLARGDDPNERGAFGGTPLHAAVENGHLSCVRLLLEHGADIHAKTKEGKTPLELAPDDAMRALLRHYAGMRKA